MANINAEWQHTAHATDHSISKLYNKSHTKKPIS